LVDAADHLQAFSHYFLHDVHVTQVQLEAIRVIRDSTVSVRYSERVNARKSSISQQRTDRYDGIVGQECCHVQRDS
jgi:hypothetical protein